MIRDRIKSFERVPVESLKPHPQNWRKHPDAQREAMRAALDEIGYADALLVREDGDGYQLIDGHLRADLANGEHVPVLILDVDESEAKKLLATFDPITNMAEPDMEALKSLDLSLEFDNEPLDKMFRELMGEQSEQQEIEEDEPPEPPADPITKPGDLWICGEHRVLCGDATDSESVGYLMGDSIPDAIVTDPPYGTGINAGKGLGNSNVPMQMIGDENADIARQAFTFWQTQCDVQVWWGANYYADVLPPSSCWVVWDKDHHGMTYADAELAWVSVNGPVRVFRHAWSGNHRASEQRTEREHPTQKPIALYAWIYQEWCSDSSTIVDPFLGSGTTMIAAEQLGRRCYGIEISPQYCDVIVQRWENLTGRKAERYNDSE